MEQTLSLYVLLLFSVAFASHRMAQLNIYTFEHTHIQKRTEKEKEIEKGEEEEEERVCELKKKASLKTLRPHFHFINLDKTYNTEIGTGADADAGRMALLVAMHRWNGEK